MSRVVITKSKIDNIATALKNKLSYVTLPVTLDQIVTIINNIDLDGGDVNLQVKSADPKTISQIILPDTGYTGLSQVNISAISVSGITINSNGDYTPPTGTYYNSVTVDIEDSQVVLQVKTVTPTKSVQSIVPDTGYSGLSSVRVDPIPSNYVDVQPTTATVDVVVAGSTFYDSSGTLQSGLLVVNSYYIGSDEPSADLGQDGDIYFKV